jgi:dCTP deaminase
MILTGAEIKAHVASGDIGIDPFDESLVNPNSYNYRLGNELLVHRDDVLDPVEAPTWWGVRFPETGYTLQPGRLYLGHTYERIGSTSFVTSLIGRSSMGRLGLFLQITADLGHIGAVHGWTLELSAVQPVIIYPRMTIGQVSFWRTEGRLVDYEGSYAGHSRPIGHRALIIGGAGSDSNRTSNTS